MTPHTPSLQFYFFVENTFLRLSESIYVRCRLVLNHLRMNLRFEKITPFHCISFGQHLTFNLKGVWHILFAMLRLDDVIAMSLLSLESHVVIYCIIKRDYVFGKHGSC